MKELPRAILIDLDDTIIDDSGCVESCWQDACAEDGLRIEGLDVDLLRREVRAHADAWWSNATRHQIGRLDLRAATREIVTETMRKHGWGNDAIAAEVAGHYRDLREERTALFPGSIETLEWLRSQGVRLGMMTNGGAQGQRKKIEQFALEPYFDHILIEGEFGCGKPDPRVFATLLDALQVESHETWAVGDNIEADVFGAMDAGIHGIWINAGDEGLPNGTARSPDRVVTSLRELMSETGREHG